MVIQIEELKTDTLDKLKIRLRFDGSTPVEVEIDNPHNADIEKQFEWYFEEYLDEPYSAETKVDVEKRRLAEYGKNLFGQLFGGEKAYLPYRHGLEAGGFGGLVFEIVSSGESFSFQAILWESLWDPSFDDAPLVGKGAIFYRSSTKNQRPALEPRVNEHPEINLLIVTARPSEENDVNHRTIQRPLIEIIRRTPKMRVRPFVLRPGTFKALKDHLNEVGAGHYHIIHFDLHGAVLSYAELEQARALGVARFKYANRFGKPSQSFNVRHGREDIKSFEGKNAFLFFETDEKGVAEPALASEVASLLQENRIPVSILNACQSAKQEGISNETNLAKYFHEKGTLLVLAMRFSVSVTAAERLMSKLYNELLNNKPFELAISLGRRALFDDKKRDTDFGYPIDLEDWVLPVIFQRQPVRFNLRELSDAEKELRYERQKKQVDAPRFSYGFHGRDLDILKIEKMLLPPTNHLLLRGMAGVGKSALLRYLAWWWRATGFRSIENSLYFDFRANTYTFSEWLDETSRTLFERPHYNKLKTASLSMREGEVLDYLNHTPHALLLDNIFQFKDSKLLHFLSRIQGASFVVYGSVGSEEKLKGPTFGTNTYLLDGLDKNATHKLASEIIRKETGKDIRQLIAGHPFEFGHLLNLLMGFPSAMQSVLPALKSLSVTEVLDGFRNGTLDI